MHATREELQSLCSELRRIHNLLREDDSVADLDLLRVKLRGCWKELQFYLDTLATL